MFSIEILFLSIVHKAFVKHQSYEKWQLGDINLFLNLTVMTTFNFKMIILIISGSSGGLDCIGVQ